MANLLDWNTLISQTESYIDPDNSQCDSQPKAFQILILTKILGISEEEALDSITDGL